MGAARGRWRTWFALLTVCVAGGLAGAHARAASLESLLEPGKVIAKHAKFEEQCNSCHDRANHGRQSALCLACHKDIAADVNGHRGWHGRLANAASGECAACHSDHLGREADIVHFLPQQFDHAQTEFALEGAHQALACAACHRRGEPWRAAKPECHACHQGDDVHAGQLGADCGACHGKQSWHGGQFDHGKTDFALAGAHTKLACNACHLGGQYKNTPRSCNGCHAPDDVHQGSRGTDCQKCHNTTQWRTTTFDHARETHFALDGQHAHIECTDCHRGGDYKRKLPTDCAGCHRADDAHALRFGVHCEDCHNAERWRDAHYDHATQAHFELLGAHAKLACHTCHTAPTATQKLGKTCGSCHRAIDPHGGKLGSACEQCHGQNDWRREIAFDHDLTDYPLTGLHGIVTCAQCHRSQSFHGAPLTCKGCHAAQDVHRNALGPRCESCHSTNGWNLWQFDHAKQTHFPLTGAHRQASCADCHRQDPGSAAGGKTPTLCVACHRNDDRHLGQFGPQCGRCHSTASWLGAHSP